MGFRRARQAKLLEFRRDIVAGVLTRQGLGKRRCDGTHGAQPCGRLPADPEQRARASMLSDPRRPARAHAPL
eukprot:8544594-Alexandrium_andersonii.AAC.1